MSISIIPKSETYLKQLHLFSGLESAALRLLAEAAQEKNMERGAVLFLHGDAADALYIVASGWVKLFRQTLDGQESIAGLSAAGDSFGEAAVFREASYPYGAEAVAATKLLRIPGSALQRTLQTYPQLAMNMMASMSRRMNQLGLKMEHFESMNAAQRVGCFLLRLSQNQTGRITLDIPVDKALVAASLGMKPETFSRALAQLKDTGVVVKGANVAIESVEKLCDFTCISCSNTEECDGEEG